jgi:hypothetical protein
VNVFVETRGRSIDYAFLGSAAERRWWLHYRRFTSFEDRTIVLRSGAGGWQAYVGGIDSSHRRDLAGRTIRFALMLEGGPADEGDLLALLQAALPGGIGSGPLAAALDSEFPEELVERVLADDVADRDREVARRAGAALRRLPRAADTGRATPGRGHLGNARDAGDRDLFLGRAAAIARGGYGRALLLNLIHREEEADALFAEDDTSVVLAPERVARARREPDRRPVEPIDRDVHRIAMVGPAKVGKTTLVTALLSGCQRLLDGRQITLSPDSTATKVRVALNEAHLSGLLGEAGSFGPACLGGASEPFTFELALHSTVSSSGIRLAFHDCPMPPMDHDERLSFIAQSTVLLVPIDAGVVMETALAAHRRAVPSILATDQIQECARSWARERDSHRGEPALLLLCPVKCESYFPQSGGRRDRSPDLLVRLRETYAGILRAVRAEAMGVQIWYCPVDTIGCVELIAAEWVPRDEPTGFKARYRVHRPAERSVKGVDDLFILLCWHLIEVRKRAGTAVGDAGSGRPLARDLLRPLDSLPFMRDLIGPPPESDPEPPRTRERAEAVYAAMGELALRTPSARVIQL